MVSTVAEYCCRYSLIMTHDVRDLNSGLKLMSGKLTCLISVPKENKNLSIDFNLGP